MNFQRRWIVIVEVKNIWKLHRRKSNIVDTAIINNKVGLPSAWHTRVFMWYKQVSGANITTILDRARTCQLSMYDASHLTQTSGNHDILFYLWDAQNIKYELLAFQAKNLPLYKLDNNEEVTNILKFHVQKSNIVDRALLITCLPCTPRFCWRIIYPYTNFHTNDLWRNQRGLAWDTQRHCPRLNRLHHSQVFSNHWRNPTYPVSISVNYGASGSCRSKESTIQG